MILPLVSLAWGAKWGLADWLYETLARSKCTDLQIISHEGVGLRVVIDRVQSGAARAHLPVIVTTLIRILEAVLPPKQIGSSSPNIWAWYINNQNIRSANSSQF